MGTSSSIQKGSPALPQDTALRQPPTPIQLSMFSMEEAPLAPTPRSGSRYGEMTPSTPLSPKVRSPDSSIEIWVNGQFSIPLTTLTKLTVITSSGKLDLFFEIGGTLRVSRISMSPNLPG